MNNLQYTNIIIWHLCQIRFLLPKRTTQFCMHTLSFGFLQNVILVDIDKDNRLILHKRTYAYKQKLHKSLKLISAQPVKHLNKSPKCNLPLPSVCLTHFRKKTNQCFNWETKKFLLQIIILLRNQLV